MSGANSQPGVPGKYIQIAALQFIIYFQYQRSCQSRGQYDIYATENIIKHTSSVLIIP